MAISMIFACKKDKKENPQPAPVNVPTKQHDTRLIGTWVLDSAYDGQEMIYYGGAGMYGAHDTLFVSSGDFYTASYSGTYQISPPFHKTWETVNDSIFTTYEGEDDNHYQFYFTNSDTRLFLTFNSYTSRDVLNYYRRLN